MIISQFPQRRTKNLLINAGFRVNQRNYVSGTATAAANEYTLDRWRVLVLGESITFPALGADNTITAPAGGVGQKIESLNIKGGVYTVNWQGSATCKVNGVVRKTGESFVLDVDALVDVVFYGGAVNKPQLEMGSVQTEFEFVGIGEEFLKCQRFFFAVDGGLIFFLANGNDSLRYIGVSFPVKMRVLPSIYNFFSVPSYTLIDFEISEVGAALYCTGVQATSTLRVDTANFDAEI